MNSDVVASSCRAYRKHCQAACRPGSFANYCPECGVRQEDYLLHSEPGDVFFGIELGKEGAVEFTPVAGRVGVRGDYGFEL